MSVTWHLRMSAEYRRTCVMQSILSSGFASICTGPLCCGTLNAAPTLFQFLLPNLLLASHMLSRPFLQSQESLVFLPPESWHDKYAFGLSMRLPEITGLYEAQGQFSQVSVRICAVYISYRFRLISSVRISSY